jgi:The  BURPS668_1122 family of deaminases
VYHKGVVAIKGTKKEIEEFAEKLKGMTDDAVEKYLDDLLEDINKYKAPTKFDIEEIGRLRKLYKPRPTRNVAFCKAEIDGVKIELECVSGGKKAQWKQKGNFEPHKPENYHFKNGPERYKIDHTEQKIFEYLYKRLSHNKNAFGKIEIVTDLKFCDNCKWIINQFQKEFKNIEIIKTFIKTEL